MLLKIRQFEKKCNPDFQAGNISRNGGCTLCLDSPPVEKIEKKNNLRWHDTPSTAKQASAVRPSKTRCLMLVGPTNRVLKNTKQVGILSCRRSWEVYLVEILLCDRAAGRWVVVFGLQCSIDTGYEMIWCADSDVNFSVGNSEWWSKKEWLTNR